MNRVISRPATRRLVAVAAALAAGFGTLSAATPSAYAAASWTGWSELAGGGTTTDAPAAIAWPNRGAQVFVRGTDNRIYENDLNDVPGPWTGWHEVPGGGRTLSAPAAAKFWGGPAGSSLLLPYLFVRGTDDHVYENIMVNGSWHGWSEVPGGGLTKDAPTAAVNASGLHLFVRGLDNNVWENIDPGNGFRGWHALPGGGQTPSAPAAATLGTADDNELRVFVRGTDDAIYQSGSPWQGWGQVAGNGRTPSAPASSFFHGQWVVFVRGTDNSIYENRTDGAGWRALPGGGKTLSAPAAAVVYDPILDGDLAMYTFVRGTDNRIYWNRTTS